MSTSLATPPALPWYRGLTGYQWFVLAACSLGWLFDTMDQQLFILARAPAMADLLGGQVAPEEIKRFSGIATMILMFGWATGGIVFGMLGDRWGRAKTMLLAVLAYSLFTGLSALSVSWIDFSVYRFLTGVGVGGQFAAAVSLVAEVMPARSRPFALGTLMALSGIGNMSAAGISYLLKPSGEFWGVDGWRLLFLVGAVPALLVLVAIRRLKEPEGWIQAKKAAMAGSREKQHQLGSLRELFGDARWLRHTLIGITMALAGIMGLWGIGFWMPELVREVLRDVPAGERDTYVSTAMLLQNAGAFLGIYAYSYLTSWIGRRPAFAVSFLAALTAVVGVFGFMTQPSHVWWMPPILGFATLMAFGGYSIYFPELFPARLRSTGVGFCYNTARYVAALAPLALGTLASAFAAPLGSERAARGLSELTFLGSLGGGDNPIRYAAIVVASVFLLGLLALPFAPETKDKPLPE